MSKKTTKSKQADPHEAPEEQRREPRVMSPDEAYDAARKAEKKKRPDVAEKLYRKILAANSEHGKSAHALGVLLLKSGREEEAVAMLKRAASLIPETPLIHYHLAVVFHRKDHYYEAEMAVRRAMSLDPESWHVHQRLGLILVSQERFRDAARSLELAIEKKPDNPELYAQLGGAHHKAGDYLLAEVNYRKALALKPGDLEMLLNFSAALVEQDRSDEAETQLSEALSKDEENPRALTLNGRVMMGLGRLDEARAQFQRALEIEPREINALFHLSRLHDFERDDPMIEHLLKLENDFHGQPRALAYIYTALGNAMDRIGDYDAAFRYFERANRAKEIEPFDPVAARKSATEIVKIFDRERLSVARAWEDADRTPVFVLGTPRSGKTLLEALLKRHPDVVGIGENKAFTNALKQVVTEAEVQPDFPQAVARLDAEQIEQVGRRYIDLTRGIGPDRRIFVNTIPGNVRYLGAIGMALPQARLVSIERDAMDVCFKMFSKHFAYGNNYTLDLRHQGMFYAQHRYQMRHWCTVLGERILTINYEALVTDTDSVWSQLLHHLGLRKAKVPAMHFSAKEIGVAEHYRDQLRPLREALRAEEERLAR